MTSKKKKPGGAPSGSSSVAVIAAVNGLLLIPGSTFSEPVMYVAVFNSLGSAPYVGPIFRVDQSGHFLENVWAKVTMNAATPTAMRIVVPMNYRDTSDGALYDPSVSFQATITYDPTHSFYVDETGSPVPSPRYLVELS
jgi:hypothetical protein